MPGVPRAMYLPFPFEITQTPNHILIAYEFAHVTRTIFLDGRRTWTIWTFWMGDARGKWEGDTLVVDTVSLGDKTWFDESGNFHSDALKVVERFTPMDATHINYEATIDDSKVFTRPWKMSTIIYRRLEKNSTARLRMRRAPVREAVQRARWEAVGRRSRAGHKELSREDFDHRCGFLGCRSIPAGYRGAQAPPAGRGATPAAPANYPPYARPVSTICPAADRRRPAGHLRPLPRHPAASRDRDAAWCQS